MLNGIKSCKKIKNIQFSNRVISKPCKKRPCKNRLRCTFLLWQTSYNNYTKNKLSQWTEQHWSLVIHRAHLWLHRVLPVFETKRRKRTIRIMPRVAALLCCTALLVCVCLWVGARATLIGNAIAHANGCTSLRIKCIF